MSALGSLVLLAGATALAPASQAQSDKAPLNESKSGSPCPTISVSCPSDVKDGELIIFSATISPNPGALLTYSWTAVGGTILEGQGTSSIKVNPSGGSSWTASLAIGGLDPSCASTASCSLIVCRLPLSRKLDSYGVLSSAEEAKRLASFAAALENEPAAIGYVLSYARQGGASVEAKTIADRAKTYLVSVGGVQVDRIVTLEGGFKDQLRIELWVVPSGAAPPKASDAESRIEPAAPPEKKTVKNPIAPLRR